MPGIVETDCKRFVGALNAIASKLTVIYARVPINVANRLPDPVGLIDYKVSSQQSAVSSETVKVLSVGLWSRRALAIRLTADRHLGNR